MTQRPPARDRLAKKRPITEHLWMGDDAQAIARYNDAVKRQRAVAGTRKLRSGDPAAHAEALAIAKQEVEQARADLEDGGGVLFVFKSLGGKAYERLVMDHPITEKQLKDPAYADENGKHPNWNPDTFPAALVHATLVEPEDLTVDDVREEIFDGENYNQFEQGMLFSMAVQVNQTRLVANLGNV